MGSLSRLFFRTPIQLSFAVTSRISYQARKACNRKPNQAALAAALVSGSNLTLLLRRRESPSPLGKATRANCPDDQGVTPGVGNKPSKFNLGVFSDIRLHWRIDKTNVEVRQVHDVTRGSWHRVPGRDCRRRGSGNIHIVDPARTGGRANIGDRQLREKVTSPERAATGAVIITGSCAKAGVPLRQASRKSVGALDNIE